MRRLLGLLLGAVFILSAVTKAVSLNLFGDEIMLYLEIYFNGWLSNYHNNVAGLVCLVELFIGIFCFLPKYSNYACLTAFAVLSFFVYLTGDNYFNPSLIGRIESCGCFGELIHFTPLESFIKSCVLWTVALACIVTGKRKFVK